MPFDILGLDHIYITVSDIDQSIAFYDRVMQLLGFYKGTTPVGGQPHAHYYNRVLQYTIRPAKPNAGPHDPYVPGLHHICFQVADKSTVDAIAVALRGIGVEVSNPALYPEYGPDYYALYFNDPDGIELEIVNRVHRRDLIVEKWDQLEHFEDPMSKAGLI